MRSECLSFDIVSFPGLIKILSPEQKYLMQILWDINPQEGQNKWSIIESVTKPTNKKASFVTCIQ